MAPSSGTRERRTVAIGIAIVALALLASYILLPAVRRWNVREVELGIARNRAAELTALTGSRSALDSAASARETQLALRGRRIIHARSTTLAASALQSFLQDASDASRLVVTRLDVAPQDGEQGNASDSTGAFTTLPATLSAYGDITGLADLLAHLRSGPRHVRVERLTVQQNSALRGASDMLQITLSLRAPVVIE